MGQALRRCAMGEACWRETNNSLVADMKIQTVIRVMNNVEYGHDVIEATTTCQSTLSLHIPVDKDTNKVIELNRADLREFLARTKKCIQVTEHYEAL